MNTKQLTYYFGLFISINFLLLTTTACQKDNDNQESILETRQLSIDNANRRYAIYVPANIDHKKVPIVFELHGGGVYIEDMTGESGYKTPYKIWMQIADTAKFIVVYPEGLNGLYGKPTWNDCRGDCIVSSQADDVAFIEQLINTIHTQYDVDLNRIYVSGTSNGGLMSLRLAVQRPNTFAAFAVTAASLPAVPSCGNPETAVNILFMNGTDDNHLPYEGGTVSSPPNPDYGTVISTEQSVETFTNLAQINTLPQHISFPDLDPNDGGIVEKFTYQNSQTLKEVILYKVNGGGHSAPSIREQYSSLFEAYFNKQNHDIEMCIEVWNFFRNKQL